MFLVAHSLCRRHINVGDHVHVVVAVNVQVNPDVNVNDYEG